MNRYLKSVLLGNNSIKVISLILGYTFWFIMGSTLPTKLCLHVPLCFYNTNDAVVLHGPQTVAVTLRGTREQVRSLMRDALAIHVDATTLHAGSNALALNNHHLLLPDSISLVHYSPSNIIITQRAL